MRELKTQFTDWEDAADRLHDKLHQLQAMVMMTHGEAQKSFDSMNGTLRDNFMFGCFAMVEECIKLHMLAHGNGEAAHV